MDAKRQFTLEELKEYDGKEGRSAYIGYEGKVYDVTHSKLWRNGVHVRKHFAGTELTAEMEGAPHTDIVMDDFVVVGVVVEEKSAGLPDAPRWAELILNEHPHPITVHFPIALGLVAALLTFISLFMQGSGEYSFLVRASLYLVIICALGTPASILTGLLSWYYNYGMKWDHIYKWKIWLSVVLVVISAAALILRFTMMDGTETEGTLYWAYTALVIAHAPVVVGLGYWGGRITFPR